MYYLLDDIINIKNIDLDDCISYETANNAIPSYFIIIRRNSCIYESNEKKYLTLVSNDGSKYTLKIIRSI